MLFFFLTFYTSLGYFSRRQIDDIFLRKQDLETICMKCLGKNKKKRTIMVLYRSPEQTDYILTNEVSLKFTAWRFLYKFYVQVTWWSYKIFRVNTVILICVNPIGVWILPSHPPTTLSLFELKFHSPFNTVMVILSQSVNLLTHFPRLAQSFNSRINSTSVCK